MSEKKKFTVYVGSVALCVGVAVLLHYVSFTNPYLQSICHLDVYKRQLLTSLLYHHPTLSSPSLSISFIFSFIGRPPFRNKSVTDSESKYYGRHSYIMLIFQNTND